MIVEIVTPVLTLVGVIFTAVYNRKKTTKEIQEFSQVNLYRLDQLEKKQDKYNNIIKRTYELEKNVAIQTEQIKEIQHIIN